MMLLLVLAQMFHDSWYGAVRVGSHTAAAQQRRHGTAARVVGGPPVQLGLANNERHMNQERCAVVEKH